MWISQKILIELLRKALGAIEIAEEVMDYCSSDHWERKCTESNREKFNFLTNEIRKAAKEYGITAK